MPGLSAGSVALCDRVLIYVVIAAAALISLVWVFRVPLLQQPDESAHVDYVFAIRNHGGLILARNGTPAFDVTPQLKHLEDASGFRSIRYNPYGRVPAAYTAPGFFHTVDASAPPFGPRTDDNRLPYVAFSYPPGYYALAAGVAAVAGTASGGSLTFAYFAIRVLGVLLLFISIWAIYRVLRLRRVPAIAALLLTAGIAVLPMTSWVSAYVQPDTLAFAATCFALYLVERWSQRPFDAMLSAVLGIDLAVLALTKEHYAVAVLLPVALLIAATWWKKAPRRIIGAVCCALAIGPALLGLVANGIATASAAGMVRMPASLSWGSAAAHQPALIERVIHVWILALLWVYNVFLGGSAFQQYWGAFSWTQTTITPVSVTFAARFYALLGTVSAVVLAASLIALALTLRRIGRVGAVRSKKIALMLLVSDTGLLAYGLFTVLALYIFVKSDGTFGMQGRYWLPLILPATLFGYLYAPRVLPRKLARKASLAYALAFTSCAVFLAPFGLRAIDARFYAAPLARPSADWLISVKKVGTSEGTFAPPPRPVRVEQGESLAISGWAIDYRTGEPGARVDVTVDGRAITHASYHQAVPTLRQLLSDDAVLFSGFSARVPTASLSPGHHSIVAVLYPMGRRAAPLVSKTSLDVLISKPGIHA